MTVCARPGCSSEFEPRPRGHRGAAFRYCAACREQRRRHRVDAGRGDNDTFRSWLRGLPAQVAEQERAGSPVVVTVPPTLEPHQQRLLGTLGVLIRFEEVSP